MILRLLLLTQHSLLEVVLLSLHNDLSFVPSLVLLSQLLLHFAVTPAIMMFALSGNVSVAAYGGNLLGYMCHTLMTYRFGCSHCCSSTFLKILLVVC